MQHLDLSVNALEDLPDQIWDLPCLEDLILRGNALLELPAVPPGCAAARKLRCADLRYNLLYCLPAGVEDLARLEDLAVDADVADPQASGLVVQRLRERGVLVGVAGGGLGAGLRSGLRSGGSWSAGWSAETPAGAASKPGSSASQLLCPAAAPAAQLPQPPGA